jgi:TonB family protein
MLKLLVSETGDVEQVDVISGDPILADSAVDAAKKWKFKPFMKNGKPVKVSTKLPMDFAFREQVTNVPTKDNPPPAPGAATGPMPIASGMASGLLIRKVSPVYPVDARRKGIEGVVILRAVIDKDGRISQLSVVSGPKELAGPATGAVQQWRYRPYMLNGEPVQVQTEIQVNFQLQR